MSLSGAHERRERSPGKLFFFSSTNYSHEAGLLPPVPPCLPETLGTHPGHFTCQALGLILFIFKDASEIGKEAAG